MRGSYGGVLMFGMLTSFAGLGHVQPAVARRGSACWAARPTRRTWRTGCSGCATRPRPTCAASSTTCRSSSSKESRDRLKGIQRQLRDHYRGIANQTTRSLNESLQATLAAAKLEENERNTRVEELERQLNILRQVIEHAVKLATGRRSPPSAADPEAQCERACTPSDKLIADHEHERSGARDPWRHHPGVPGRSRVRASAPTCTTNWSWIGRRLNQPIRIALAGHAEGGQVDVGECARRRGHRAHRRHRGHPHRDVVPQRRRPPR